MSVYFDEKPFSSRMLSTINKFGDKQSSGDANPKRKRGDRKPKRYWSSDEEEQPRKKMIPQIVQLSKIQKEKLSHSRPQLEKAVGSLDKKHFSGDTKSNNAVAHFQTQPQLSKTFLPHNVVTTVDTDTNKDNKGPANSEDANDTEAHENIDKKDSPQKQHYINPQELEEGNEDVDIMGVDETEERNGSQQKDITEEPDTNVRTVSKPFTYRRKSEEPNTEEPQQHKKKKKVEFTEPPISSTKEEKDDNVGSEEEEEESSSEGEGDNQSKGEDKSDVILYYNIVTTERGKGKRKVKPKDYVTATEEASSDDDDYFFGSEGDDQSEEGSSEGED